jgi:hypothetical protein
MQQAQVLVQKDVPCSAVIGCIAVPSLAATIVLKKQQQNASKNSAWHRSAAHMPLWLQAIMTSRGTQSL